MDTNRDRPLNGLLIGTASAATQIEGGETNHNWYQWAHGTDSRSHVADASSPLRANDHWNLWREDNALMAELGFPIARISLEWSRIEPRPGQFSSAAIERYRAEIADLKQRGIEPLVTLHHFANPLWLQKGGQWTNPRVVAVFLRYVRFVVTQLSDLVNEWVTINEPNVYATQAHLFCEAPPGNVSLKDTLAVLRHMAIAHLRAYQLIHEINPAAVVTFAHHMRSFAPKNRANPWHRVATNINAYAFQDQLTEAFGRAKFGPLLGRCPLPAGDYADVIGLNYYSRTAVSGFADGVYDDVPLTDLGWEVYAPGLVEAAAQLHERLQVPVWITENGCADNGDERHLESFRPRYLAQHLAAILDSGLPIERYYHWCFIDNWEWSEGEAARFGVVYNDYETQQRVVKPSGYMLQEIIERDCLSAQIENKYAAGQAYRDPETVNRAGTQHPYPQALAIHNASPRPR